MNEHKLGFANDLLQDGEMRAFELDDKEVLLARVDGVYYALSATCTHYGGPLAEGMLKDHTVMCPWHHACFDVRSGLRIEPPALNNLPRYHARIVDGEVVVDLTADRLTPERANGTDDRHFVIVGGGAAGNMAAEELRMAGFGGRITMISAVPRVPVDRPNLSKDYLAGEAEPDWIPLRSKDWYAQHDIDLRLATRVEQVDPREREIRLSDGQSMAYDKLLLATGGKPRQLDNIPGAALEGIYTLRTQADADTLIDEAERSQRVVVIGGSFIGMEVAASLASPERGLDVTVVEMENAPFAPVLGERVGRVFQQTHEANGVKFKLERKVTQFHGSKGRVSAVELDNGSKLPTDFVVVGIGVDPATDFLADSGLALDTKSQALLVDETLRTSDEHIYAAGDIASYPSNGRRERIEHWRVAEQHGMVVARNLLGSADQVGYHVPFFWTNQWDIRLRYVGHAANWDDIIYRGQPEAKDFIAFYMGDNRLLAAAGCNRNLEMVALEFALRNDIELTPEQLQDDIFDLAAYVRTQRTTVEQEGNPS